ncbi:hypothetical protein O181_002551 [Austropuccinia psidii MF-1]|uniref:Uncharacterized protein n=1 Tax=Austropuccinia psidii MF-1 TaxID=1389203 RepID=A0A9Q3GDD0_9BASI|nr:hypothetical protein [Austropuccinia psidii MF-1]
MSDLSIVKAVHAWKADKLGIMPKTLQESWLEMGAFNDFKLCIASLAREYSFPGWQAAFDSEAADHNWRTHDLANLQPSMLHMIQTNHKLSQSQSHSTSPSNDYFVLVSIRPESIAVTRNLSKDDLSLHDPLKEINEDHQDENNQILPSINPVIAPHHITYIPPNPIKTDASLTAQSLDSDQQSMKNRAEYAELSLKILSQKNLERLAQCAL